MYIFDYNFDPFHFDPCHFEACRTYPKKREQNLTRPTLHSTLWMSFLASPFALASTKNEKPKCG